MAVKANNIWSVLSLSICHLYANACINNENMLFDILDSGVFSRNIYDTAAKYSAAQNASLKVLS